MRETTGHGSKVSGAAKVTRKAFAEWLVRALTLVLSPGFLSSGRHLALLLVRAVLPLEHHLRAAAEGSLLQDEQKHQHSLAHSSFLISSVENLLQIWLVTNAYTRLGQTSIKSSSGNFLLGVKEEL